MTNADEVDEVVLSLTHDEAVVLFDWLTNHEQAGSLRRVAGAKAEHVALSACLCALESVLVEPFLDDYDEILAAARRRLPGEGIN